MKIAMIGQKGIPSRAGGVEIHVEEISKRLVCLGYQVEAYCRRDYCDKEFEEDLFDGIKVKYTPFIKSKHLDAITHTLTSTFSALLSDCDLFHYHALGPSTLSFIPRLFGKKVICTVHGLDWQRGKWGKFASMYLKFGEFASARFSHRVINVSKNLVEYYRNKYGIETQYIPNGIQRPDFLKPNIIKSKHNLEQGDYILCIARIVPEKGIHYLIDAYSKIRTDKKLVIAGGSSHSNSYESELKSKAKGNKNIIFTGFVKDAELAELYSNAYFYVLPSDVEGLPISLLEAMSYGNCCLVSDIPENTNVISTMGYSFEKSNIEDLARKLNLLLQDEDRVNQVKKYVSDYVIRKYNWDEIAVKTSRIYKEISQKNKVSNLRLQTKSHKVPIK